MRAVSQFARFLVAGGIAAIVNLVSRKLLASWLSYSAAIVVAYLFGMLTAYVLTRRYVFGPGTGSTIRSAIRFAAVNAVAVAQTWGVSLLLARHVLPALGIHRHTEDLAHLVGVAVPIATSYIGHRVWTFR